MDCKRFDTILKKSRFQKLTRADERRLDEHAAVCSTCREILEEERMLDELLGVDVSFEPRPGFFYKAESVVRSEEIARRGFFETVRIYRVSFALAVVLILVVAFGSVERHMIVDRWNTMYGVLTSEFDRSNPQEASLTSQAEPEEYPDLDEVSRSDKQLAEGETPDSDEDEDEIDTDSETPVIDPDTPRENPRPVGLPLPDAP